MDKFTQLVDDLVTDKLNLNHVQMAIREYIRRSPNIPDEIKNLLTESGGLIYYMFRPINQVIGSLELAFRRGKDYSINKKKEI